MGDQNITEEFLAQQRELNELLRNLIQLQSLRSSTSNTNNSFDGAFISATRKSMDDLKDTTKDLTKMSRSELEAEKSLIEYKIKEGKITQESIAVKLKSLEVEIKTRISEETKLEVTKKTVKSLNDFQKTLSEVNGDVSKFNKFIEGMGSGAESLIKNSVRLDTYGQKFGLEAGKLGNAVVVTVKAITSLTTAALTQTQQLLKAFDDLSEVGATTYETTASIRKLGAESGYSGEALLKFSSIAKGVGSNLIGLGTSASSGLKVFSEMTKVGNKTYEAFNRLGVSQEQLTEAQAGYVKQAMMSNAIGKKAPEELRKASLDYVEALVKLRDLTGMNIKEQQSALEAALAQKNFSVYINSRELEAQELRNKASKMQEGEEKQRTIAQMKAIEAEVNGKKAAAIAVSQLDEKTRTAYLQGMSTAGETVMSELVAQQEKLAGHQISAVNRLLNQGKVVEALTLFQNSTVNAVQTSTKTFGSLAALGSGFDEIHDKFMGGAQNYETANRLQRISNEERQKEIEALLKSVETRKQEGIIVDKEGKEREDGAKNTQNVINTLGRTVGEFKSDVIDALNPFTKSTLGAAAASGALMLAAGGAAAALTFLSGKKVLGALVGALGRLIGIGGAGAATATTTAVGTGTGLAAGAAGLAATATRLALPAAIMYGVANTGDYVAGKFGMGKDEKGEDLKLNEEADEKNWERMSAGQKLESGIARGIEKLGSLVGFSNISREAAAERIKNETEYFNKKDGKSTDTPLQTKPAESTTTTVESGGQKAVNVNVVQSVPLTVNIDKFLDPLFKLSKLGPQPASTFDSDFTLADVNDKVTLPVKISAMSEGFETLFKSMNNHLFIIANKIDSGVRVGAPDSSGTGAAGSGTGAAGSGTGAAGSGTGAAGSGGAVEGGAGAAGGMPSILSGPSSTNQYSEDDLKKLGLNIKPGESGIVQRPGAKIDERLIELAKTVQSMIPGVVFTGFNDNYHDKVAPTSNHTKGRAFDIRLPPKIAENRENRDKLRQQLISMGAYVIDEYSYPSAKSTGGHFHVEIGTGKKSPVPPAEASAPVAAAPAAAAPVPLTSPQTTSVSGTLSGFIPDRKEVNKLVQEKLKSYPENMRDDPSILKDLRTEAEMELKATAAGTQTAAPQAAAPVAAAPAAAAPAAAAPAAAAPAAAAPATIPAAVASLPATRREQIETFDYNAFRQNDPTGHQEMIQRELELKKQFKIELENDEKFNKEMKGKTSARYERALNERAKRMAEEQTLREFRSKMNAAGAVTSSSTAVPAAVAAPVPLTTTRTTEETQGTLSGVTGDQIVNHPNYKKYYDEAIRMPGTRPHIAHKIASSKVKSDMTRSQPAPATYASGGIISGPGTSTSDSVPAFNKDTGQPIALSTGEYVLPANVTSMLGKGYLDSLISSPNTLKRQKGGSIPGKGGKEIVSSNDLGEGMREVLYSDGSRTLSGGFGTRFFDSSGNLVKMTSPNFGGLTQTVYPSGKQDLSYKEGPMSTSKTSSGRLSAGYEMGIASIGIQNVDPRYAAMGLYNKDASFSATVPTGEKSVTKTFTGEEISEMMKKQLNEGLVENALGNTATLIGDPMKEVLTPYLEKQEKTMGTLIDVFNKLFNEMERSNSTQSEILTYTRN